MTPTASHGPDSTSPGRWLVPVLTLTTFVTMLNTMALGPLLPDIADDLHTSVALLGQIPALSMLLAAAIGLGAGPLVDRVGHRRAMVVSLVGVAASALGMGLAPGYGVLLLAALAGTAGRAIIQPVAVVIASVRYEGDRQRRAISWVIAGVTGAVIVGVPGLTGIAGTLGWRAALGVLGVLTAALVPLLHRGIGVDEARPVASGISWRDILRAYQPVLAHRPTLALFIGNVLGGAAIWMMATYLAAFYTDRHGFTTHQVGWVYFVPGATMLAGSLIAGGRAGELPMRPIIVVARLVIGVAILGAFTMPVPALVGLSLLGLQGLAMGISNVITTLLLVRESPAGRATTMTLNVVTVSIATALGSMLGGVALSISGFGLIGIAAMLLSGTSAVLVWATRERPARFPVPAATS